MMASEAQMIMTLSMKKIVESRNRRGGASLHRNLLVAGVLFKARDMLLTESAVTAAADSSDKLPLSDDYDANTDVDRTSCDEMDCERTGALSSPSDGKENVPPSSQTPDHPRCDDVEPPTDKTRSGKRLSRDAADDDVAPCKTTRADASSDRGLTAEPLMDVDDDVSDEACRQTCSSMSCPSSSVALWSSTVIRLPCLDSRPTQHVSAADPPLVRPLLVVQVVWLHVRR